MNINESAKERNCCSTWFRERMAIAGGRILINNQLYKYIDIFIIFYCYNYYTFIIILSAQFSRNFYSPGSPRALHRAHSIAGRVPAAPTTSGTSCHSGVAAKEAGALKSRKKICRMKALVGGIYEFMQCFFGIVWVISCVISNQYRNGLMLELKQ